MTATFLVGDVFDRLAEIPDGTVDLVVTSPPFLALRSYLPDNHPDKHKEIGSETTPAEFLDTLLALTAEWGRVLAPHGSIAVELGDTYAGSGGGGDGTGWPLEKSLTGIPTLYAWSLAYGRNLLTGQESPAGQWRIRNVVAWVRPNPPVGALADKYRPATSYVTVATRARDRWFDLDAVRVLNPRAGEQHRRTDRHRASERGGERETNEVAVQNPAGAPPLDWWEIVPGGYSGAHYAVMPPEIPKRLIDSMCPRRVCVTCGRPSRRIVEGTVWIDGGDREGRGRKIRDAERLNDTGGGGHGDRCASPTTVGWSTCGCPGTDQTRDDGFHPGTGWRPGLVLDPFAGSGTTGAVTTGMGRDCVLIDLDERNAELARERIGMFLTVHDPEVVAGEQTPSPGATT